MQQTCNLQSLVQIRVGAPEDAGRRCNGIARLSGRCATVFRLQPDATAWRPGSSFAVVAQLQSALLVWARSVVKTHPMAPNFMRGWRNGRRAGLRNQSERVTGSNPSPRTKAPVAELADALRSRRSEKSCRFDACRGHHFCGRGEMARRDGLKPRWRNPCRFKSGRPHQISALSSAR